MSPLDMRTVVLTAMLTNVVCTLVVLKLWLQNRHRYPGMGYWVADRALQSCGLLLVGLRGQIPDFFSIVVANFLVILGAWGGFVGMEKFAGIRGRHWHNGVFLIVFVVVHCYFSLIDNNLFARSFNVSLAIAWMCSQCAWLLLKKTEESLRPAAKWAGFAYGAFALVCGMRMVFYVFYHDPNNDYLRSGTFEVLIQAAFQMLFILLVLGLTLMVNGRLVMDIQSQEEKFSKAFHSSPYAITLTRMTDGTIFEVNEMFFKVTGYAPDEVMGRKTPELKLWKDESDRDRFIHLLQTEGKIKEMETEFRKKNGDFIIASTSADIISLKGVQCVLASIKDITEKRRDEQIKEKLLQEREKALSEIKVLSGMLPICASCKKIRDDKGYWNQIEIYIKTHSQAEFTHGLCPDCMKSFFPHVTEDGSHGS